MLLTVIFLIWGVEATYKKVTYVNLSYIAPDTRYVEADKVQMITENLASSFLLGIPKTLKPCSSSLK